MEKIVKYANGTQTKFEVPGSTRKFVFVNGVRVTPVAQDFSSITLASPPAALTPIMVEYDTPTGSPTDLPISSSLIIGEIDAPKYNNMTLVFTGPFTVTLTERLPAGFSLGVLPPDSGVATIAFTGGATGNGSTAPITRSKANNATFAIISDIRTPNAFVVTGA